MINKEMQKKKVFLRTFGCQMNTRDSEVMAGLLAVEGMQLTDDPAQAEAVIFNTCSVRQHAEDKVWSEIGRVRKMKGPDGMRPLIGLTGCMAQNYREGAFRRIPEIDFVVGPADIAAVPGIVKSLLESRQQSRALPGLLQRKIYEVEGVQRPSEIYHTGFRADPAHCFVVISEGCSNFCSYCVVPYTRGALRHRKADDIMREIADDCAHGVTSITLLGQNVNAFRDGDIDFPAFLRKVDAIPGLQTFDFITSHPKDTSLELFKAMAECTRLKKLLHLPVQSGSDRILAAMNRGYTRSHYLALVAAYRKAVPNAALTTDVIVGYPGESDDDFQQTYSLVEDVQFDAAFIFKYSVRPHTAASALADDVPQEEKERRHAAILALQKEISRARAKR